MVMEAKGINFSYNGEAPYLINDFNFILERGDKVCIAGANGKGKTTLAKIFAGVIETVNGEVKVNPQVEMAYYEQGNSAKLEDKLTVEEEIYLAHPGKSRTETRTICGSMMFSGDNALKKIAVLSGGERSRVLLAKTLLSPSNLLILDEPTHHLDMESCTALLEAVKGYEGAAIVVTHDEYFLYKVATKLIIFKVAIFPLLPFLLCLYFSILLLLKLQTLLFFLLHSLALYSLHLFPLQCLLSRSLSIKLLSGFREIRLRSLMYLHC